MRAPPRTRPRFKTAVRKTAKWGGVVATLLLLVVWIGSVWWQVGCHRNIPDYGSRGAGIAEGRLFVFKSPMMQDARVGGIQWVSFLTRPSFQFSFVFIPTGPGYWYSAVPLWFPALLSLLATTAAWRADWKYLRRAREGLCTGCGYDRAGLAAGAVCPECGAAAGA
jgi:hypothetical protein